jgi:hypothetical protein
MLLAGLGLLGLAARRRETEGRLIRSATLTQTSRRRFFLFGCLRLAMENGGRHVMNRSDNELEFRARELLAYLDTELAVEESLPFAVSYLVEQMRAAVFAKSARTLAPAQRCRLYRHCP